MPCGKIGINEASYMRYSESLHFDPELVIAFYKALPEILKIKAQYAESIEVD